MIFAYTSARELRCFLNELVAINKKYGGFTDIEKYKALEESFYLIADSENIDFDKLEFIRMLNNLDFQIRELATAAIKDFRFLLRRISLIGKETDLNTWIALAGIIFEALKYASILHERGEYEKKYAEESEKYQDLCNLLDAILYLLKVNVIDSNLPIYSQMKEELTQNQLVLERRLKEYYKDV